MAMAKVTLNPLTCDDREQFIRDNQEAFNYGALEEFWLRDDHLGSTGVFLSRLSTVFKRNVKEP